MSAIPTDANRLANSAMYQGLYRYAIPLWRRNLDPGDKFALRRLARVLVPRGDLDGTEQSYRRGRRGDGDYAWMLAELLWQRGDLDGAAQVLRAGPTPATRAPLGGWPGYSSSAGTWTSCASGPTPATGRRPATGHVLIKQGRSPRRSRRVWWR